MLISVLKNITDKKYGIEIGGPSLSGTAIYESAKCMDNVIFSKETLWSSYDDSEKYRYYADRTGRLIISDAVDISSIQNESYDFVFASHSLEHIANPIKALKEWLRIIKDGGFIILIVPEKSQCFDHNREYSKFTTLLTQYHNNVGEDDLSTLPEILNKHDLSMDLPAGDFVSFTKRSLNNINNRALHHYVYDDELLHKIAEFCECAFVYNETNGLDRWFIMKK
jgi:SAM-dependent methyltransferase